MYVRKEAVLSSQIEGTQSSLHDLLAAEAEILSPERPRDVEEVINYVRAVNHGLERLTDMPVCIRLIREMHRVLLEGVRGSDRKPGELRRGQNYIGPRPGTLAEAVFIPPPADLIPETLGELESFLHSEDDLPLLVKIGLAHAQFETIHPFEDGNGRVGRLLITFLLCERQVLMKPVLYLSYYLRRYRQEYYESLQAVRDAGDWEGWLTFFLQGVAEVSAQATETARRILALRENHRALIAQYFGRASGNGHRLLEWLYERPIVSVNEVQDLIGTSYPAANALVSRMEDHGILREITGHRRNRRFRYEDYVQLFADAEPEVQQAGE